MGVGGVVIVRSHLGLAVAVSSFFPKIRWPEMGDYCFYCGRGQPSKFGKSKPVRLPILCPNCGSAAGDIIGPMVGDIKEERLPCPNCGQWLLLRSQAISGQFKVEIFMILPPTSTDIVNPF
jgi:hypothetical protein